MEKKQDFRFSVTLRYLIKMIYYVILTLEIHTQPLEKTTTTVENTAIGL